MKVRLGFGYDVLGTIALDTDGKLVLEGNVPALQHWVGRLQRDLSNEEFVRTLPQRSSGLLWMRQVTEETSEV